jgi:hypothetical protein
MIRTARFIRKTIPASKHNIADMKITGSIISLLLSITSYSQIPNSDFENWSVIDGMEEPVNWQTNNEINSISVSKTTDRYGGDFALQVINNGPSFEGPMPGYATVVYTSMNVPAEISAYVKCDSISGTGKGIISVVGYSAGKDNEIGKWETSVEIPHFTLIKVPLNPARHYDSIAIRLEAYAGMDIVGWPTGHASIKADRLSDGSAAEINEIYCNSYLEVFPNPCHDELLISCAEGTISECTIFNACGIVLYKKNVAVSDIRLDLEDYQRGLYFIRTVDNKGIITNTRVIKR